MMSSCADHGRPRRPSVDHVTLDGHVFPAAVAASGGRSATVDDGVARGRGGRRLTVAGR